jgi:RNA polymerase sigma factor (sigma-70 family)
MKIPSDHEFDRVMTAARGGEEWAWRRLYGDVAPRVRGYLRGAGAVDPDDLLGEVLLQVVRDLPRFAGDHHDFVAWTLKIAYHRLLDDRRRRGRRIQETGPIAPEHEPQGGDTEEEALARAADERIQGALRRLPQAQRDVVLLRVLADLTVDQVAGILGRSPGAVKQLQRRGLAALRQALWSFSVTL